jgi:threonine dehydrogenase-like Zn-dependent dehydrogenase
MNQLTFVRPGTLAWTEAPPPEISAPTDAIVRPFVAARCDGDVVFLRKGTARLLRWGARLHLVDPMLARAATNPFAGPFPYGHECVAEVVRCGEQVRRFAPGNAVIVPWAVSCGSCPRCVAGLTSHCERNPKPLAAYGFGPAIGGFGGMVSDALRVPFADHMLVPVPPGVDPLCLASASDNLPDGYRTVGAPLKEAPGSPVLVVGGAAKSIGLYAAGIAVALGSTRVDYVDSSSARLDIAAALGANPVPVEPAASWFRRGAAPLPGGYPIVVDASSAAAGLAFSLGALAPGGRCTSVGFFLRKGTPLPLWRMYLKSTTLHIGVSHPRASLPEVLPLVASGRLRPEKVFTRIADWKDADRVFLEPTTKVVVHRARSLPVV